MLQAIGHHLYAYKHAVIYFGMYRLYKSDGAGFEADSEPFVLLCLVTVQSNHLCNGNLAARLQEWLLETGVLLSCLLFAACVAYMTATTFFARVYLYLSPMYVMELLFSGVAIPFAAEMLLDTFVKKHKERDNG